MPTAARQYYIDPLQAHYRDIVAPMAAAQPGGDMHGPFVLLHRRGPDAFEGGMDAPEHYWTGKVIKALLTLKLS